MTPICVGKLTIIGSDNGFSPGRRQAIIWTNAGILLIWTLGTNFSQVVIEIQTFSLKKICLKMSFAKGCPFRLSLNVLSIHASVNKPSLVQANRLSPSRCQAIIWTNAGILLIMCPWEQIFCEFFIKIQSFSRKNNKCENVLCKILAISSRSRTFVLGMSNWPTLWKRDFQMWIMNTIFISGFKFHRSLFQRVLLTICQHWSR